jgi:ferric-chelate reductase [NAD(P)H]
MRFFIFSGVKNNRFLMEKRLFFLMDNNALHLLSYGMYVISARSGNEINGQMGNCVFQVSSEPPQIAVSINKKNLTYEFIKKSGLFSVSVLSQDTPIDFIGLFGFRSGREIDKFAGLVKNQDYVLGDKECPILIKNAVAYLEAEVVSETDAGTHTIFLAKVIDGKKLNDSAAMNYDYYKIAKKGVTPSPAPTYQKEQ